MPAGTVVGVKETLDAVDKGFMVVENNYMTDFGEK